MGRLLGYVGHEIREARTAQEACRLVDELDEPVQLFVCDLSPHGRLAAITLLSLYPDIRVLFMSGSDVARSWKEHGFAETVFLAKPFGPPELFEAVERVLA